jgi:hypothetical protein
MSQDSPPRMKTALLFSREYPGVNRATAQFINEPVKG